MACIMVSEEIARRWRGAVRTHCSHCGQRIPERMSVGEIRALFREVFPERLVEVADALQ